MPREHFRGCISLIVRMSGSGPVFDAVIHEDRYSLEIVPNHDAADLTA